MRLIALVSNCVRRSLLIALKINTKAIGIPTFVDHRRQQTNLRVENFIFSEDQNFIDGCYKFWIQSYPLNPGYSNRRTSLYIYLLTIGMEILFFEQKDVRVNFVEKKYFFFSVNTILLWRRWLDRGRLSPALNISGPRAGR